ncbi:MAG: biopolymer transporter Tol [Ignavibacteria bacterium]|nr:biopolymer transporter Tol [Ignavibacteria bacterium]
MSIVLSGSLDAQEKFHHPELEWNTIETEHFYVHYHDGAERTGQTVAKIAEDVYEPVTSLYAHEPDQKVSFIIRDYDDISNGIAYFYDNKIVIYAPSMDFDFRGTHNWLRNVVTHEFTHIVQIQTTMKFGRRLPAFYFQWLGYESERRPDVLYGFPNVVVSTPFSGFVVPAWFAEGVAQYNRKELRYDFWDSHRDMILRSYVLDGNMLTWEEMSVFGKTSLGNESSYNAGFAFVHYIAQRYGEDKLNEISRNLAGFTAVTIDGAIERAIGKPGSQVYDEWREQITGDYKSRVAAIERNIRQGQPLVVESDNESQDLGRREQMRMLNEDPAESRPDACCLFNSTVGFANLYPAYSPDGKKFAYVSTKNADYVSQSSLYVYDFETKKETLLQSAVRTSVSWSPDGTKIYYGRTTRDNPHWSLLFDIFVYDLEEEEETRLTYGKRALSPAVSPDGSRIVFVVGSDGTTNLATAKIDGSEFRVITPYINGEQAYTPRWDPSGSRIIFDYSIKDGRDIASVRPDGSDLGFLITGPDDSRSGMFSRDGSRIVFSSDRTGVFNLYSYDLQSGRIDQITNVLGGAFMPTLSPEGDIAYAAYTSSGYKIYKVESPGVMAEGDYHYIQTAGLPDLKRSGPLAMASNGVVAPQFEWSALRGYDDTKLPEFESKPYKSLFTSLSFVPFIRVDNYNKKNTALEVIKPGVYLFSNDVLDKTGFFAGAALNKQLERDLFLQFNYRGKIPIFYQLGLEPTASIELYNVTRKTDNFLRLDPDTIPVDITYNLFEFDFVLNHLFLSQSSDVEFRYIHSRYTSVLESFILPAAGRLVPGSSDLYLIGNDLSLTFRLKAIVPSRTSEINPVGRKISFRIGREFNKFNPFGDVEETDGGGLAPVYQNINFTKAELNWKEHIPFIVKNHTLTTSLRGASILGPAVDDFFDFYAGGLIGMKGYPYFALSGNELAVLGLAYRFPISNNIDVRFLNFYFDKLYASIYGDLGNAWTGRVPSLRQFKKDAGIELRLESFSFYSYPTRIFFNAAYGFDRFDRFVPSRNATVTYGKEWRFYFGVLFGFDFD